MFESFPLSNMVKTALSCDVQWLFLNSCEHKLLVSQDFQYPHVKINIYITRALALILTISHFVLSTP